MKKLNQRYAGVAWGAILIWLSLLMIIPGDQGSLFILGVGVILLALNLVRTTQHLPVNLFSLITGGVALGLGGYSILGAVMGIKAGLQIDLFPILVLVLGLYLLIPEPEAKDREKGVENAGSGS